MMTNGDPEGRIFLSYLHTNNGLFFLLTAVLINLSIYLFIYLFIYLVMMALLDALGKIQVAWVR